MKQISRFSHFGELSDKDYFRIALSVDCVIFGFEDGELKVLVINCNIKEYRGKLSLLGDLVRPDEDLDSASYRILRERTGLGDVYLEQVQTFGAVDRHPAGRVITTTYFSLVNVRDVQLTLAENDLHWHPVNDIHDMAFDHLTILHACHERLREKVDDHPVVFNLLPKKFSLRELQCVYEAILNTRLDRRNFRKKFFMMDWLVDLDELEQDVPHRPGKLYRFNAAKFTRKPKALAR
ncbi:NUDIX hydrolase [Flavihumibacter petaseus]|uniref:Putative hydrolase n=1 Tax=Flavihumibacter petaseus NBRC 106054 TaxID=1220578 RepID=A0A0E9MWN6_9BACT|nr:NUDIX domain-containing protein [Flavihumibacter petaseus]GAO41989.1 putative hydrolase [Flavihumibacter petaseus NBRC 106054]